ncbi:amino acid ABC transporter permease [Limobrevibacterium gyesilva]|uniref:Amino acid ABC transporter permease n=1 Tax=Limobrevibacterium gyesilva TaxID=2991712 RepID=A0AA41YHK7_9PROT|nr:amino acid ABC transporter permease [Limobrevibacterium gyesilva]MCW3473489.1 amino acid ABC transporter permease [Limobrevibacterium gyesilva]
MSTTTTTHAAVPERERPPAMVYGPIAWARANLFNSWWSTAVTLALIYLLVKWAVGFIDWAFVNAVWTVPTTPQGTLDPTPCRNAKEIGACWAVIGDKYRFILFGRYPYDEQWRPAICIVLFIALYVMSAMRRFWRKELALIWIAMLTVIGVLMWGGVLGMPYVPQDTWGGLPITLILATFGLAFAFPLAILVALGRRSTKLPAVRMLCVVYVELIRGVPLISLLFMASVMFPLFMPVGMNPDKLLRAQVAIILFAAAYLAEVVRGGLQALPKGQYEAADALGLSYWQKTGLIIMPQALRLVIPPLVNTFIGFFKDTSLVLIIGIFDLLTSGKVALAEPIWQGYSSEVYIVLAIIYFIFCWCMARYSRGLEQEFSRAARR